jgi:hypothetical protein
MAHAIALMKSGIDELRFIAVHGDDEEAENVDIYEQNIEQMTREIQAKFAKHQIVMPVVADDQTSSMPTTVNNFHGPVVNVTTGDGARVAWGENVD